LGLIFTLDPNSVDEVVYLSPWVVVTMIVYFKCCSELPPPKKSVAMYNYRKGDYKAINNYLGSINWSEILSGNVHDDWQVFKTTVQNTMANYIPTSIPKSSKATPSW